MKLLILGGTADARHLTETLHNKGVDITYSVAGLVRTPKVDCQIVSGGFQQFGGLVAYLSQQKISAILDSTHPYASRMSNTAIEAAEHLGIHCWRFHRAAWQEQDIRAQSIHSSTTSSESRETLSLYPVWQRFADEEALLASVAGKKRVFVTLGQVSQRFIDTLAAQAETVLLRTAVKPSIGLPNNVRWVKAIGPFKLQDEFALMKQYQCDALLSKNSGGDATVAKLLAAHQLNIPVYMLDRPVLPAANKEFNDYASCEAFVLSQCAPQE